MQEPTRRTHARRGLGALALAGALLLPRAALAEVEGVEVSPDITVSLDGVAVFDEQVSDETMGQPPMPVDLGPIPRSADVNAYTVAPNGDVLFSLDTTVDLGDVTAAPVDVVRWDGSSHTLEFDASAMGVPAGIVIDALGYDDDKLILSLDVTLEMGPMVVADEDVIRREAGGTFSTIFDGSAEGVPEALDLDGVDGIDGTDNLVMSFDGHGSVGGVDFADEDVLEFIPGTGWSLAYDGSAERAGWEPGDADAVFARPVPEPGAVGAGAGALGALALVAVLRGTGRGADGR